MAKDLEQFREGLVIGNLDRVALVSFIDRILIYDDFRVEIVFKYRQEMERLPDCLMSLMRKMRNLCTPW